MDRGVNLLYFSTINSTHDILTRQGAGSRASGTPGPLGFLALGMLLRVMESGSRTVHCQQHCTLIKDLLMFAVTLSDESRAFKNELRHPIRPLLVHVESEVQGSIILNSTEFKRIQIGIQHGRDAKQTFNFITLAPCSRCGSRACARRLVNLANDPWTHSENLK